jgi:hypothetical protein
MKRFCKRLFHVFTNVNKSRPRPQGKRRTQLNIDVLENRLVPAAHFLNLAGQTFTLQDNNGATTGNVAILTENATTGAFTGTFTDRTSNELGVVDSIQGQLSATSTNIFGQNAATISFQGQGTGHLITSRLIASETNSVDFAGRVTQALGGSQLELLGSQDVQDTYTYREIVLGPTQGLAAAVASQQSTVNHNPHEFVSSDFMPTSPTYSLPIADSFALYDNNSNYLGTLENITRDPTNFSHFEGSFVGANGTVIPVTGQISPYAADGIGGHDSTIAFSGQTAGPGGNTTVAFNGRETEVGSAGIALAGELETTGYNEVPIYYYNPITHQVITGVALVPYDNHEFAYAQEI